MFFQNSKNHKILGKNTILIEHNVGFPQLCLGTHTSLIRKSKLKKEKIIKMKFPANNSIFCRYSCFAGNILYSF